MARVRYDNSVGTLAAGGLGGLVTDTTINFQTAPTWAALANGDYIPLIVDPPGASPNGNYEVVYVTAYAGGGATAATIKRAQQGTARVAHAAGATWMVAPTTKDFPGTIALPRQLLVFGHSYASGNGLITAGVAVQNRQSTRLAQALAAVETNYGVGGCCLTINDSSSLTGVASTGGFATILQKFAPAPSGAPYVTPLGAVHLMYGVNDYCMYDTGAHFQTVFQTVLQAVVDRLRCGKIFEDSDASVSYPTGAWGTNTLSFANSGTTMHNTNAAAATVQIALPADYNGQALSFGTCLNGGAGANWSTVAACSIAATDHLGTNIGNLDLKAIWLAFQNATTHNSNTYATLRIPAGTLPAGAQNLTLTYTNPANNSIWFDWWGIEADVPPKIVLEAPLRLPAAGYTALGSGSGRPFPIDDTGIANILASLNTVANIYTDGRVLVASGADAVINKSTSYLTSDNVHPNVAGAGIVAMSDFAALASWLADNPQEALETQRDNIGPNLGQLTVARAYASILTSPFINGWNKINVNTLSFDPGSNFDLTNHRYICPSDGYYAVKGQLLLANQASDSNYMAIYVNGTRVTDGECSRTSVGATGTLWGLTVDDIVQCKKGDYIELFFNTANTTASFMSGGDSANDYLSVVRVA